MLTIFIIALLIVAAGIVLAAMAVIDRQVPDHQPAPWDEPTLAEWAREVR